MTICHVSRPAPRCTEADHALLRADPERMRAACTFYAMSDAEGYDLLELYTCPACRSTLATRGIGPDKENA